jgi:hypothetical protein
MFVSLMVELASTVLDIPADEPEQARRAVGMAHRQLHLIIVGRRHWLEEC